VAPAGATETDPSRAMLAGSKAFLEVCLDPAVQQIVLLDAPAVLGWKKWRETDQSYYLESVKTALAARVIAPQPVGPLAHVIMGALNEVALIIAHADDEQAARREVTVVIERLVAAIRDA